MTILLFILGVVVFFISTAVSLAYLYVKEDESDDWPFGVSVCMSLALCLSVGFDAKWLYSCILLVWGVLVIMTIAKGYTVYYRKRT